MSGNVGVGLVEVRPPHAAVLAALHDACFDDGWSVSSFETTLQMPGVFGFIALANDDQEPLAFAVFRAASGETEVITIATHPDHRGQGLARALMKAGLQRADSLGSDDMFLEVAADNEPAIHLYSSLSFVEIGRRKGYYSRAQAQRVDALVMVRKAVSPDA